MPAWSANGAPGQPAELLQGETLGGGCVKGDCITTALGETLGLTLEEVKGGLTQVSPVAIKSSDNKVNKVSSGLRIIRVR